MATSLQESLGIILERQQLETLQAIEERLRLAEIKLLDALVAQLAEGLANVAKALPTMRGSVETALERAKAIPSVGGKLKLVLPLIPFVLQYETEVGVSTDASEAIRRLKSMWVKLVESAGGGGPVSLEL